MKQLLIILCCIITLLPSMVIADTFGQVVYKGKTLLRIRTVPEGAEIGELKFGDIVKILIEQSDSWYKIEYNNGLTGYSYGKNGKYIKILPQEKYEDCVEVVFKPFVNVRNGPSYRSFDVVNKPIAGSILRTLSKITYYENRDGKNTTWFEVENDNEVYGYINGGSKYVEQAKCYELDRQRIEEPNVELQKVILEHKMVTSSFEDKIVEQPNCYDDAHLIYDECALPCKTDYDMFKDHKECEDFCEEKLETNVSKCE